MRWDVLLMETETTMQKATAGREEEEADGERKRQTEGRAQGVREREVRPRPCIELTSSLAGPGTMPEHSTTSGAHRVFSPLPLLLSLSLSLQT